MATTGEMVDKYILVRDKMNEAKKRHKAELEPFMEALNKLEAMFATHMDEAGVTNLKTDNATAFITTMASVRNADKIAFIDFVKENEAWHLLDIRASKTAVKEYIEENDAPPPGVSYETHRVVQVRKA